MMKKIDEIIKKLQEIPREDITKECELSGVAHAFLLLPKYLDTDLSYETEIKFIKAKYDSLKRQVLLEATNKIGELNEEYEEELKYIKHIKESNERAEAKLKALGL